MITGGISDVTSNYQAIDDQDLEDFVRSLDKKEFIKTKLVKDSYQYNVFKIFIGLSEGKDIINDPEFKFLHKDGKNTYKNILQFAHFKR